MAITYCTVCLESSFKIKLLCWFHILSKNNGFFVCMCVQRVTILCINTIEKYILLKHCISYLTFEILHDVNNVFFDTQCMDSCIAELNEFPLINLCRYQEKNTSKQH